MTNAQTTHEIKIAILELCGLDPRLVEQVVITIDHQDPVIRLEATMIVYPERAA
jgi:hypothetical protein